MLDKIFWFIESFFSLWLYSVLGISFWFLGALLIAVALIVNHKKNKEKGANNSSHFVWLLVLAFGLTFLQVGILFLLAVLLF